MPICYDDSYSFIYLFIYLVFLSAADEVSKGVMKSE